MTTHCVTAYRQRTTAGSQIALVEERRDAPRREIGPLTVAEAQALVNRLDALILEATIETTGGVPPTWR